MTRPRPRIRLENLVNQLRPHASLRPEHAQQVLRQDMSSQGWRSLVGLGLNEHLMAEQLAFSNARAASWNAGREGSPEQQEALRRAALQQLNLGRDSGAWKETQELIERGSLPTPSWRNGTILSAQATEKVSDHRWSTLELHLEVRAEDGSSGQRPTLDRTQWALTDWLEHADTSWWNLEGLGVFAPIRRGDNQRIERGSNTHLLKTSACLPQAVDFEIGPPRIGLDWSWRAPVRLLISSASWRDDQRAATIKCPNVALVVGLRAERTPKVHEQYGERFTWVRGEVICGALPYGLL